MSTDGQQMEPFSAAVNAEAPGAGGGGQPQ